MNFEYEYSWSSLYVVILYFMLIVCSSVLSTYEINSIPEMCLSKKIKEFYDLHSECTGKLWRNDTMMPALLQYICILHE